MKKTKSAVSNPKAKPSVRPAIPSVSNGELFPIVGIGASAGGLEAFKELLGHMPNNIGMGFVLVQHLAPQHESALPALLSRSSNLPVTETKDGIPVEPNHVYVIPPNTDMHIRKGRLFLTPRSAGTGHHMPIDSFLRSLAADRGKKAVGIILSGTGSDGTLGLTAIRAEGGITFAQSEESAAYPEMPRSAEAAGCVDFILSPEAIARELQQLSKHPYHSQAHAVEATAVSPKSRDVVESIYELLREHTGVNFSLYKQSTIKRRMWRRMALHRIHSPKKYLKLLENNLDALDKLYQDILIHVTGFFRDPKIFEALKKQVFPTITAGRNSRLPLRIWVPGCSTGEEAYSILIALLEFLGDRAPLVPIQLFATDISETAVAHARAGVYRANITTDVNPVRLKKFFDKVENGYRIIKSIRDMCVFARHDVTHDPPFSKLDLISCRNLLIYLGPVLQKRVLPFFEYALKPGGFLFLGSSESIGWSDEYFTFVDKRSKIYSRKLTAPPPVFELATGGLLPQGRAGAGRRLDDRSGFDVQKEVDRILLTQYSPPGVVVNSDLEILQFRGRTGHFLEPSHGHASLTLSKMAREGLMADLRAAIHRAKKEGTVVRKDGINIVSDGRALTVSCEVVPIKGPTPRDLCFLLLFKETPQPPPVRSGKALTAREARRGAAESRQLASLRNDLAQTKAALQSIIDEQQNTNEELRSANEEALSSNEELQSTNEELETAKEELQSANEELTTVNQELLNRNTELGVTNSDLSNLLATIELPIILVGGDLCIRRFTPIAEKLFNIIPSDVGRPIAHLRPNVDIPDVQALISESINSKSTIEREVRDREGRWYLLRVQPYRTVENRIEGAVLMVLDIDALKAEVNETRLYAEGIVNTVPTPFLVLDDHLKVRVANRGFYETFKVSEEETENRFIYDLGNRQWNIPKLRELLEEILPARKTMENFTVDHVFPSIGHKVMVLNARTIHQRQSPGNLILLAIADITDRTQAIQALRQSQTMLERLFEMAPDALVTAGQDGRIERVNLQVEKLFGYRRGELLGKPVEILLPARFEDVHRNHRQGYYSDPRVRPMGAGLELFGRRKDGSEFPVDVMLSPLATEEGTLVLAVVRDISDRRRAEDALRESEQRFHSVLASSPSIIFVKDLQGRYVYTNPQFRQLKALTTAEIEGKRDDELFPPDQAAAFRANDATVLRAGRPMSIEEQAPHEDGLHTSLVNKFPLRDTKGKVYGLCGIVTDITDRKRAEEALRLLVEVTAAANQAEDLRAVTPRCFEVFCKLGGWQVAQSWFLDGRKKVLRCDSRAFYSGISEADFRRASLATTMTEGQGMIGQAWKSKEPVWVADLAARDDKVTPVRRSAAMKAGLRTAFAMPILVDRKVYAIWEFFSLTQRPVDIRFIDVARRLGNHLSIVFERKLAEKTLADLSVRLMKTQDEEHRRIARDLHDSTAQTLSAAAMNLAAVNEEAASMSPRVARLLSQSESLVGEASDEIRTIAHLLHPQVLDQVGLVLALRGYVDGVSQRSGIRIKLTTSPRNLARLPQEIEIAIFRVVQEGLTNVHRHASAKTARIRITKVANKVMLELSDLGKGMSPAHHGQSGVSPESKGLGIASMRERIKELGGQFEIKSNKRGTTVKAILPIKKG